VQQDTPLSTTREKRQYIGLKKPNKRVLDVLYGEVGSVNLSAGSTVSITNIDGHHHALLSCFDKTHNFSLTPLDIHPKHPQTLDLASFDNHTLLASIDKPLSTDIPCLAIFDAHSKPAERFVLRVTQACKLFVVAPHSKDFIAQGGGSRFHVEVQLSSDEDTDQLLPEPLAPIVEEFRVARGSAKAYRLKKGQFVQVIDVQGQQCSDFMAVRTDALAQGLERSIDSTVSRTMSRSAYPQPGLHDKFYDQDMCPMLAVRQDTVGRHDTFALACTARGYEERGFPGHLNCSDNISEALAPFGIAKRRAWPAINFFFNSWIDWQQHHITSDEAWSRPGDYVVMQALTDLICVSTACPDDVDPINGWNPTDIHIRIYQEDSAITHSISWRAKPDDGEQLTKHTAFHSRTKALTSNYTISRDLWMPSHFDTTGAIGEYWSCRNSATLQDMSSLLKYDIVGPDAAELLQHCLTRNVAKLAQYRGFYALICDERGSVLDDGTLFRLEDTAFRWCCASPHSALHLREQAKKFNLNARVLTLGHQVPNLAIQGPKSRDILRKIVFIQPFHPALDNLKWFGFTIARLRDREGPMFMLCRTGFTGELGYEIFCDKNDALQIWDTLIAEGAEDGLVPMGNNALGMLRIEAGLMVAGAEFGPDSDAFESGLGFAVDLAKESFIGKTALERNSQAIRRTCVGLIFNSNEAPMHGDGVFIGREQVGVVTSACDSPELGHAIAIARIAVENSELGNELAVGKLDGYTKRLPCVVTSLPFIDPKREKARA